MSRAFAHVELPKEFKTGWKSGEGRVQFYSHDDAGRAMAKDREHMGKRKETSAKASLLLFLETIRYLGTRYVELFLDSEPDRAGGGFGASGYTDFSRDQF